MTDHSERTALYRHFDASGDLLYVGISHDPLTRWEQHPWWKDGQSASHSMEWFATRQEALAAETAAIASEKPRLNVLHNWEPVPFPCAHWPFLADLKSGKWQRLAGLMRDEIEEGRWLPGQKVPRQDALAASVGLGVGCGIRATNHLHGEGLISKPHGPTGYFVNPQ